MAPADPRDQLHLSWTATEVYAWRIPPPGRAAASRPLGRFGSSGYYDHGERIVPLRLPGGTAQVRVQRLPRSTLIGLCHSGALDSQASASVAWFRAVVDWARQLARAGRVIPHTEADQQPASHPMGMKISAIWSPLTDDVEAAAALLASMPPVVGAAHEVSAEIIARAMVDSYCRLVLAHAARALVRGSGSTTRALRSLTEALTAFSGESMVRAGDTAAAAQMIVAVHALALRAENVPLLGARLRLSLPSIDDDDIAAAAGVAEPAATAVGAPDTWGSADTAKDGGWGLRLEFFDLDDRSRWCSAPDLAGRAEAARRLVPEAHRGVGEMAWMQARASIAKIVAPLTDWSGDEPVPIEVAAAVLDAVGELGAAQISVIAPEGLTRATPSTRGTARPAGGTGAGRFGRQAIVEWSPIVAGAPVDEADLQRIADGGAGLLHSGGRWVMVSAAAARRALDTLAAHRQQHTLLSPLELLRLAAEVGADERGELAAGGRDATAGGHGPRGPDAGESPTDAVTPWTAALLAGLPDAQLEEGVVDPSFAATLRPYQRRGVGWLQFLHTLGLGGCLADDMGLGKTPTTLAHLLAIPGPHLVVCPLSVVRNWEAEARRFTPSLRIHVHHGSERAKDAEALTAHVAAHDVIVTTYQVAARDIAHLAAVPWSVVVLDEAQAVKNPETRTAKALRTLRAEQHIALTGTPVENRLLELWSILQLTTPGLFGSQAEFRRRFVTPIEQRGDADAALALRQLAAPFLLRRTKADRSLVPDLPDKVEQVAWATLTPEQAHLYQAVVDRLLIDAEQAAGMKRRGLVLAALTRLKQICNHPAQALRDGSRLAGRSGKLHRFDELVDDLLDAGEQALIFTQFTEMGDLLQQHLFSRLGVRVPFLQGKVPKAQRDRMVARFQDGTDPARLLLVSLRAGGTGLNLTAASRVIHYDRWWNPAVEDQATDRAWRIGQQRAVFVHKLVCQGTVEERIDALIAEKKALAEAVIGTTGEQWLSELSTSQLRELVVLDRASAMGRTP